jgi:hypothetical protein
MIIVRIWGGLGNQLFQYAFAYAVAKKTDTKVYLDKSFYTFNFQKKNNRFTKQKFQLDNFNIDDDILIKKLEIKTIFVLILQSKYINKLIRVFPKFNIQISKNFYYVKETRKKYLIFDKIFNLLKKNKVVYFDGYWQSYKYFIDFNDDLLRQFKVHLSDNLHEKYKFINNSDFSISIHIRRGDINRKNKFFSNIYLIEKNYYFKAIDYYKTLYNNPIFYIFTNDKDWVLKNFSNNENFVFVNKDKSLSDLDEFKFMSQFKNFIISNSTYSWWAAYLSDYKDKIVVCPEIFFGNKDIKPKEWILM